MECSVFRIGIDCCGEYRGDRRVMSSRELGKVGGEFGVVVCDIKLEDVVDFVFGEGRHFEA